MFRFKLEFSLREKSGTLLLGFTFVLTCLIWFWIINYYNNLDRLQGQRTKFLPLKPYLIVPLWLAGLKMDLDNWF